jgi:hypothetical protein
LRRVVLDATAFIEWYSGPGSAALAEETERPLLSSDPELRRVATHLPVG